VRQGAGNRLAERVPVLWMGWFGWVKGYVL
jgi:hypothetical protein